MANAVMRQTRLFPWMGTLGLLVCLLQVWIFRSLTAMTTRTTTRTTMTAMTSAPSHGWRQPSPTTPILQSQTTRPAAATAATAATTFIQSNLSTPSWTSIPEMYQQLGESIAQPFVPWPITKTDSSPFPWCLDATSTSHLQKNNHSDYYSGWLFQKLYKTGSSTAAGVHLQIADRVGRRVTQRLGAPCSNHFTHLFGLQNHQRHRDPTVSALWSIIRHPTSRSLSAYLFYKRGLVYQNQTKTRATTTTDEWDDEAAIMDYLNQTRHGQFLQLRDDAHKGALWAKDGILKVPKKTEDGISMTSSLEQDPNWAAGLIQSQILQAYNFVAVLERWDESMVVLQLLLGLEETDTIVLSSKASGGWSWDWNSRDGDAVRCFPIPPRPHSFPSSSMSQYLHEDFQTHNVDFLLYAAVNQSLDLTIQALGTERVQVALRRHRQLQAVADEKCLSKAIFPCSSNGTWQPKATSDCYWRDMGCGHRCVDRALTVFRREERRSFLAATPATTIDP